MHPLTEAAPSQRPSPFWSSCSLQVTSRLRSALPSEHLLRQPRVALYPARVVALRSSDASHSSAQASKGLLSWGL